jgi:hypothetical protein
MAMEWADFEAVFCRQHVGTGVTVVYAKYRDDRRQLLVEVTLGMMKKESEREEVVYGGNPTDGDGTKRF